MMLYLVGGLAAATLIAGGIAGCEHKRAEKNAAEREAVQARFDGFVLEAKRLGDEQTAKAVKKEADDRATFERTMAALKVDLAHRDAALKRLRDAPITRPDLSPVPIFTDCARFPDVTGEQRISVAEYRALEERAYDDALRLTRLQQWLKATGHPVE